MARKVTRRIYEYTLHRHGTNESYRNLFERLAELDDESRYVVEGGRRIFVPPPLDLDGALLFRVYWVKDDRDFVRFNQRNLRAVEDSLDRDDRFAVAAHALVLPEGRKLYFEYVRSGPKADEFVAAVQGILREQGGNLGNLGLTAAPVYAGSFLAEIRQLERVRSVRLDLVRPNIDWEEEADRLHEFAADSNARRISITASAPPRESLTRDDGIVAVVEQQADNEMSHLDRAVIEGQRPGDSGITSIRSDDHVKFELAAANTDGSGSTHIMSATEMMRNLLRKMRRRG